jgi:hypothetical protein
MPLHVTDIATLFRRWWLAKVYSVSMQTVVNSSAASLQYWWPFIVWLTSMKDMISYHEQQYRQMYMQFSDRAHLHIMTQTIDSTSTLATMTRKQCGPKSLLGLHHVQKYVSCSLPP